MLSILVFEATIVQASEMGSNGSEVLFQCQLARLQHYSIIEESYGNDPAVLVTRRQALNTVLQLYYAGGISFPPATLFDTWEDVEDNTADAALINQTSLIGIFQGKVTENGRKYAALDEYVTLEETLLFLIRLLESDDAEVYIAQIAKEENLQGNVVFSFAEKLGLINVFNLISRPIANFEPQQIDKPITFREFIELIHRSLYIPTCYGYRLEEPTYLINILQQEYPECPVN